MMDERWELYKDELHKLYFTKDPKNPNMGTLGHIMAHMKERY
jgi:hypothetical protein